MEITEIRIRLAPNGASGSNGRLRAFCSVTVDQEFVIRDLKVIEGNRGLFVAMPSRRLTDRCPNRRCGLKNPLLARFCSWCGNRLASLRLNEVPERVKLHADIAHPITPACRARLTDAVLRWYQHVLAHPELQDFTLSEDERF